MDFLWRDPTVPEGDLNRFKLSHFSAGPGHIHARSSWQEDATYFLLKCSDRFTAHQHLDAGHFVIYRHEVSPAQPSATDLFLHVLTATDASVETVPLAAAELQPGRVEVSVGDVRLALHNDGVGGDISWRGRAGSWQIGSCSRP